MFIIDSIRDFVRLVHSVNFEMYLDAIILGKYDGYQRAIDSLNDREERYSCV